MKSLLTIWTSSKRRHIMWCIIPSWNPSFKAISTWPNNNRGLTAPASFWKTINPVITSHHGYLHELPVFVHRTNPGMNYTSPSLSFTTKVRIFKSGEQNTINKRSLPYTSFPQPISYYRDWMTRMLSAKIEQGLHFYINLQENVYKHLQHSLYFNSCYKIVLSTAAAHTMVSQYTATIVSRRKLLKQMMMSVRTVTIANCLCQCTHTIKPHMLHECSTW